MGVAVTPNRPSTQEAYSKLFKPSLFPGLNMDIHHLKIFIAVHRNSSFSKASQELHISQPTVSEHIKNLESELDCILFERLGRSIQPTQSAQLLLPHALQVVEDLSRLKEAIYTDNKQIRGDIIISSSTIPGTYLLPRLAAAFKQQHPQIRFEILINDTARSVEKVIRHDIHLAVTGSTTQNSALQETVFFEDELVCVSHIDLLTPPRKDLGTLPLLIREQGSGTRQAMEDILRQAKLPIRKKYIAATLGSTAAIKEALIAGLGFSIISRMAVKGELESGLLQQIPLPGIQMTRPLVFVSHRKRTVPRRYQAFMDMVLQEGAG